MIAAPVIDITHNVLIITGGGKIVWNDQRVPLKLLVAILARTKAMRPEPELEFQPSPDADYDLVDKVFAVIRESGVTRLGIVGNAAY